MKTILIAEDHKLIAGLYWGLLKQDYNVYSAANGMELLTVYNKVRPDVILLDVVMPQLDGLNAAKTIRDKDKDVNIIIITARTERWIIKEALALGVNAFFLKDNDTPDTILKTIELDVPIDCPELGNGVVKILYGSKDDTPEPTKAEVNVLKHIIAGLTNKEIAGKLFNSIHTIHQHRNKLLQKFKVKNTAQLISATKNIYLPL